MHSIRVILMCGALCHHRLQVQKIQDIEHEMARTQKNKATSAHLGLLKAKLAKLKREVAPSHPSALSRHVAADPRPHVGSSSATLLAGSREVAPMVST